MSDANDRWHADLVKSCIEGHLETLEHRSAAVALLKRVIAQYLRKHPGQDAILQEALEGRVEELRHGREAERLRRRGEAVKA